jgi:Mg2+-importing ATPase
MDSTRSDSPFWSRDAEDVIAQLGSSPRGLGADAVSERLQRCGPNTVTDQDELSGLKLLLRQVESPLVLILIFGAGISLLLREWTDAGIILTIIVASALLGFYQEFRASKAVQRLKSRLALNTRVVRGGVEAVIPVAKLVPGDVILLSAGNLVPADGLVLEAKDFLVTEAALTGESFPIEKRPGAIAQDSRVSERSNAVFMGSSVRSGTARVLIVETGKRTAFGDIAARLRAKEPETEFQRGIRQFGGMLVRVMLVMVVFVLTVNQLLGRPVAESLLFAVALAVGLSPELLPAIISVTLSAGARRMAKDGVIVRRLEAIENLGSIDVLCTDKTGTLTQGLVVLEACVSPNGDESAAVAKFAFLNAALETGIENPLDAAVMAMGELKGLFSETQPIRKIDEIPYDFVRRRLTIVIEEPSDPGFHHVITKGAFANVLETCTRIDKGGGPQPLTIQDRQALEAYFKAQGEEGFRVLAVAVERVPAKLRYGHEDEAGLTLMGFLLFVDPPKNDAASTIHDLSRLGISVKIVSGDNRYVTAHLAQSIGLKPKAMLTGEEIARMRDEALWHAAPRTDLFVEIEPQQKERIVRALQRTRHAVGYLGDGINDAPAMYAADIGISVDQAVDVARECADVVLTYRDLGVLRQGVEDGRKTFANTMKYISITTSANFGNMVSMALVTPMLPFFPLLPKQILLNNFLSDLPSVAISTDNVDKEALRSPQRWSVQQIQRFMFVFGLISSCFDFVTFALLIMVFDATESTFHTAWFIVSLLTELGVVLVLRTHRRSWRSQPGTTLMWSTAIVSVVCVLLPYIEPVAELFGFLPLPWHLGLAAAAIVMGYLAATEAAKSWFYKAAWGAHPR